MSHKNDRFSPERRRSPRFNRVPSSLDVNCNNTTPTNRETETRRLQFGESVMQESGLSSIDLRSYTGSHTNDIISDDPQDVRIAGPPELTESLRDSQRQRERTLNNGPVQRSLRGNMQASDAANTSGISGEPQRESGAVLMRETILFGAEKVRISSAEEMTKAYAFISQIPVKKIRLVLKSWDWRVCGKKEALVAKVILQLRLGIISGKTLLDILLSHEVTSRYQSWLRMRLSKDEVYPVAIDKVPDEDNLIALLPEFEANDYRRKKLSLERSNPDIQEVDVQHPGTIREHPGDPEDDTVPINNAPIRYAQRTEAMNDSTQFCINEFARLLIIIRDDEDARSAVIAMGQELTRSQLDAGVTRADFWQVVESRYNDPSCSHYLNLSGHVDGVDSSLPPLAHRTATFLKDKFNDSKADFTQYVIRWSSSGQNDPDRFCNFLPKLANGELNALAKRMMVMFVCTRKGTPYEESHFSNVCCKLIPGGAGRDEGSRVASMSADVLTTETHRGRKRSSESDGVREIASSLSKIASCYEEKRVETDRNNSEKQLK